MMPFGVIKGFVREAYSDLPLHFANVIVMDTTRGAMTEKDGSYSIPFLPPGTYMVRAMMIGYTAAYARVVVRMGVETELSISLKIRRPPMVIREGSKESSVVRGGP